MGPDPLAEARTYLLCRDGAAVTLDPEPEILDDLLALLELHEAQPFAILETTPSGAADSPSPAYRLARQRNWFWVGPVHAWHTDGAVIRLLDRLLLELDPAATDNEIARGRRLPHVVLDLPPFQVRVEPVAEEPGRVTYHMIGDSVPASDWLARGMELASRQV